MKKLYIQPEVKIHTLKMEAVLAGFSVETRDYDSVHGNEGQGITNQDEDISTTLTGGDGSDLFFGPTPNP